MIRHATLRSAGMTLLEVSISGALTAVIVFAGSAASVRSFSAQATMNRSINVERRSQGAIDTVAGALADAGKTTLSACAAPVGASVLTYRKAAGFTGGTTTWSAQESIGWFEAPGEPVNGRDDDRNGIVDDGIVVWTRNIGQGNESKTIIARNVPALAPGETTNDADDNGDGLRDERGLSFSLTGKALLVRLAVVQKSPDGTIVTKKSQRTIAIKN